MKIGVSPIKPGKNFLDYREYKSEILEAVSAVTEIMKSELEAAVDDWDHAPDWRATTRVSGAGVEVTIKATGPNAKIYGYVDEGTRPHVIRPRKARALSFRAGYKPRTKPGRPHAGPGAASGDQVFTQVVHHPGNAPRHLTRAVVNANKRLLSDMVGDAIREAAE